MANGRFDQNSLSEYIIRFEHAVENQDGAKFRSFIKSRFLRNSEHYKYDIWNAANPICINIERSTKNPDKVLKEIGTALSYGCKGKGSLAYYKSVKKFMDNAYGHPLDAMNAFCDFYLDADDEKGYEEIRALGCGNYDVLALLAFYKDIQHYLPIRSTLMNKRFSLLGYDVRLDGHADWYSYQHDYLGAIREIRQILIKSLDDVTTDDISLLDAHSFIWLLPEYERYAGDTWRHYILDPKYAAEKDTMTRRRLGQLQYRQRMLEIWHGQCAVTGCSDERVLTASHAKPYKKSEGNDTDKIDPYNGFPLIPNLDIAFDAGLITFNDDGSLIVSPQLAQEDAAILGIDSEKLKLTKIYPENMKYLEYHRNNVFLK